MSLFYDNGLNAAYIIEVKMKRIEKCDIHSIKKAHSNNLEMARKQLKRYIWYASMVIRVAVSGVVAS